MPKSLFKNVHGFFKLGRFVYFFVFFLLAPPIIDDAISTKLVTFIVGKGESKKLVCAASGSPVPTITFTKGNKSISGAVEVTKGNKITSTLTHTANATSGAGTVKCVASSTAGKSSLDITVQVIGRLSL